MPYPFIQNKRVILFSPVACLEIAQIAFRSLTNFERGYVSYRQLMNARSDPRAYPYQLWVFLFCLTCYKALSFELKYFLEYGEEGSLG